MGESSPHVSGDMGIRTDPPGARLVRRRQVGDLHPLGPVFGAGVGAARPRHSAAAHPRRPEAHAAGEPLRRVVPQLHADQGQPDPGAPRPDLRRGLPLRQLRAHLRRRVVGRRARCHRRPLPGGGGPLRRAHHQAPRRLRPLALPCPAPGEGRVPRPPRPGGRPQRGGAGPAHAHGALLLGRLRLALQRRRAVDRGRCGAGRTPRSPLRGVRHGALPRAHRALPAVRPLERHLRGPRTPGSPSSSRTTTTPSRKASSTTAGGSPASPATR